MIKLKELKIELSKVDKAYETYKKEANKVKIIVTAVVVIAITFLIITIIRGLNSKSINDASSKQDSIVTTTVTTTNVPVTSLTTTTVTTTVTTTTFVPFETKRVGNEKVGFIEVPESWVKIEDDNIDHDDYIEYAAVYDQDSDDKDSSLAYSSIAIEYGELGEKSKRDFLEAEAKQFSAMDQYFNRDNKEDTSIDVDDKIEIDDYLTKSSIKGADAYVFETKIADYYKELGYGDGYLTVYIMFLPDNTYRAITVESNTSEKPLTTKLILTYTIK